MPPHQCPACGRFLKNDLVEQLPEVPATCPGCDAPLEPQMFETLPEDTAVHEALTDDVAATTDDLDTIELTDPSASVRPPDLAPDHVRDREVDVLAGWDTDAQLVDVARWGIDRPPFPTDTVVVLGAGVAGGALGALGGHRRGRGAALGALAGLVAAGVARRIWRLDV